eukprot:1160187-Pelagomonas_calceolata.AAC.8
MANSKNLTCHLHHPMPAPIGAKCAFEPCYSILCTCTGLLQQVSSGCSAFHRGRATEGEILCLYNQIALRAQLFNASRLPDYIVATTNPDSPEHQGSPNTYIRVSERKGKDYASQKAPCIAEKRPN